MDIIPDLAPNNAGQEVWTRNYPDCPIPLKSTQDEIQHIVDLDFLVNKLADDLQNIFGSVAARGTANDGENVVDLLNRHGRKEATADLPNFVYSPFAPGCESSATRRIKELTKCTSESVVEDEMDKPVPNVGELCAEMYRKLNSQVWDTQSAQPSDSKSDVPLNNSDQSNLLPRKLTPDSWLKSGALRGQLLNSGESQLTASAEDFAVVSFDAELGGKFLRTVIECYFKIPVYWCFEVYFMGVLNDDHALALAARRNGTTNTKGVSLNCELLHYEVDFSLPTRRRPVPPTSVRVTFLLAVDNSDDDALVQVLYKVGEAGGNGPGCAAFFDAREMHMRERWLVQAMEVKEAVTKSVAKFWNSAKESN